MTDFQATIQRCAILTLSASILLAILGFIMLSLQSFGAMLYGFALAGYAHQIGLSGRYQVQIKSVILVMGSIVLTTIFSGGLTFIICRILNYLRILQVVNCIGYWKSTAFNILSLSTLFALIMTGLVLSIKRNKDI